MSTDAFKKRRVEGGHDHQGGDSASAATEVDSGVTLAAIMAKMNEMETRNISMQNEMDSKTATMQNEIIGMKDRISKMNELEAKCESLERSVEILIDEQKWEYSAPNIPDSHWEERGFDEGYIAEMKIYFLDIIKGATCELRSGRDMRNEWIIVGTDDSDATTLLHDDLLLPHWKELANAMQLYQEGKPLRLSFINVQLTSSVIDLLLPVLKHKPIESIELQNNSFANGREGIEFAVGVMKSNETMNGFYWTSNTINTMEDARYLVDSIISHPSIDKIRLENCFGGDVIGYHILQSLLISDKNFSSIDFDRNNIRTGGGTAISDHLATNSSLKKIYLTHNNLNDEDAVLIARALKHNTNLKYLYLYDNGFTEVGHIALCNAIYDLTSLNSLSDCNHTCMKHQSILMTGKNGYVKKIKN